LPSPLVTTLKTKIFDNWQTTFDVERIVNEWSCSFGAIALALAREIRQQEGF
jgi:hypothetical protein